MVTVTPHPPQSHSPQCSPPDLVDHVSKGEVGEGHPRVAPQRQVQRVARHLVHLIVHLQQLGHCLQPACGVGRG